MPEYVAHSSTEKPIKKEGGSTVLPPGTSALHGGLVDSKSLNFFSFLYRRSTYYWTAVLVNLCQLLLCILGFTFAAAVKEFNRHDTKSGYMGNMFVASGVYSLALFCTSVLYIYVHYKKPNSTRFNAGGHYKGSQFQTILSCSVLYMLYALGPSLLPGAQPRSDDVRPTIYLILIALSVTGLVSSSSRGRLHYLPIRETSTRHGDGPQPQLPGTSLDSGRDRRISRAYRNDYSAVKLEDVTPLLKEEIDNLSKDSEATAVASTDGSKAGVFGFLYQRATYYWIAFIAQFCQVVLEVIGVAVANAHKKFDKDNDISYDDVLFISSGIYSVFALLCGLSLLFLHHKKGSDVGPKRFTAGKHYYATRTCAMFNFLNLTVFLLKPALKHSAQEYPDEIRPIIFPLLVGFVIVAMFGYSMAAYITYKAASRARGTDMVPDPEYRVPAWTLCTTVESSGLPSRRNVQLA
ncbi:hypothetical protein CVT26_004729 [Gymnopilus dilepis]|uniref:Uncharacterized protein n=1 Tax=Gymnopilus dilepis TaxID=231916 RepID=A0A409XZ86_9AGAR|nr:hypothetical protein CVT26_004729 [Gymnopilus dilepis]